MSEGSSGALLDEPDAAPATTQPSPHRRRIPWWAWPLAALALIVVLVPALGGFDEVPVRKLPMIEVGETFVGAEASVEIRSAYLSRTMPLQEYEAEPGTMYLAVAATLENRTSIPSSFAPDSLGVSAGDDGSALDPNTDPEITLSARTGDVVDFLQPGVPADVVLVWEVEEGSVRPGDEIAVGIFDRVYLRDDPIFGDTRYSTTAVARTLLRIADSPSGAADG